MEGNCSQSKKRQLGDVNAGVESDSKRSPEFGKRGKTDVGSSDKCDKSLRQVAEELGVARPPKCETGKFFD